MSAVEFMDPPPERKQKHREIAEALRSRPNEWARIESGAGGTSLAYHVRDGARLSAYRPAGSFEGVAHKTPEGTYDIYARYVGEGTP